MKLKESLFLDKQKAVEDLKLELEQERRESGDRNEDRMSQMMEEHSYEVQVGEIERSRERERERERERGRESGDRNEDRRSKVMKEHSYKVHVERELERFGGGGGGEEKQKAVIVIRTPYHWQHMSSSLRFI